jgi:hypothetical protein
MHTRKYPPQAPATIGYAARYFSSNRGGGSGS